MSRWAKQDRWPRWEPGEGAAAPTTYLISGTILDAEAVAASGVTVVLSGDASDSTVTAGDGTYSFTVEDGSYTVTPTNPTNRRNIPAATAVSVSGANETGKDFIEYLKYVHTFNDGTIGQADGDVTMEGTYTSALVAAWMDGEAENWNPSGFTKLLQVLIGSGTYNQGAVVSMGESLSVDVELNIEILHTTSASSGEMKRGYNGFFAQNPGVTNYLRSFNYTFEKQLFAQERFESGDTNNTSGEIVASRDNWNLWVKSRINIKPDGTFTISLIRAANNAVLASYEVTASNWGSMTDISDIRAWHQNSVSGAGSYYVARYYAGDAALGWPVDTATDPQYSITGTIEDGASDPISGVTVTLTGDASNSTTTAADGTYSFPEVSNGSYTVTPSIGSHVFTPNSSVATISGSGSVNDFTGAVAESLPAYIGFEGDTPPAVPADWTIESGTVATLDIIADENFYTPTSFTKSARSNISSTAWLMEYDLLALPTAGKVRIAALMWVGTGTLDQVRWGLGTSSGAPIDGMFGYLDTNANPDGVRVSAFNAGSETIGINSDSGLNLDPNDWKWLRLEIDIDAETGACHHFWASGPSTGTIRTASFAACGGWSYASEGMKLLWEAFDRAGTTDMILAGFWIGTGDDAWPAD